MAPLVYMVPVMDVTWASFGPLNPQKGFSVGPVPIELSVEEAYGTLELMKKTVAGRFVICPHTSLWAADIFYREPFMSIWKQAVERGAELCIHTHAELDGQRGTLNGDHAHMSSVIRARVTDCLNAGIKPQSYRGGIYAYANFLTPLLEELDLLVDYSSAPGFNKPEREASWVGAPTSAAFLCPVDRTHGPGCGHTPSKVLEVPLGSDGIGTDNTNLLFIDFEDTTLEELTRIYDLIASRARLSGRAQVVHFLIHTVTASNPTMQERYCRFLDHARRNGGETILGGDALRMIH